MRRISQLVSPLGPKLAVMSWATFAGRCQRPSPSIRVPAAGSQVGGFFPLSLDTESPPSGPPGLTGPAPPSDPLGALGCLGAMGKRWLRKEPLSPVPIPPTTRCALGVLGEARAVAPQIGSSVYSASVVCLLCILILLSSERDLILVGKRHTPNALILGGDKRYVTYNFRCPMCETRRYCFFAPATDQGEVLC